MNTDEPSIVVGLIGGPYDGVTISPEKFEYRIKGGIVFIYSHTGFMIKTCEYGLKTKEFIQSYYV